MRSVSSIPAGSDERERGVTLVLMALLMTALLTVVAIVIDLGQLRADRRDSQTAADLASLSAGYYLAGYGSDGAVSDPRAACRAALNSVKANVSGFPSSATLNCNAFPLTASAPDCTAATPSTTVTSAGSSPYVMTVTYPVPASDINDARFTGGIGSNDGDSQCERMTVEVTGTRSTFFAGVVGTYEQTVSAHATVHGSAGVIEEGAPAFLILERTGCMALTNSVGGASRGIIIRSPDGVQPGLAHVDSNATNPDCVGSATAVYATALPDGTPSIRVDGNAAGTQQGIIAIHALKPGAGDPAEAYHEYTDGSSGGLSVQPTAGRAVSRTPIDSKYNPASSPAISNLHAEAFALVNAVGAPAGTTNTYGCGDSGALVGTNVFVNCATFNRDASFPDATSVTFAGLDANGKTLSFPQATTIVVRGELGFKGSSGSFIAPAVERLFVKSGVAMAGGSHNLAVNSTSTAGCVGGTSGATKLVVFGGPLQLGGQVALCSTFVYLAGPLTSLYGIQTVTTGGDCTPALPCPKSNPTSANLDITGTVRWTAPNEYPTSVPPAGSQGVEDLALWTESSNLSDVKSGGQVEATGVFFLPNAGVDFRSPTLATPRNAQFIARKLNLRQGTLEMRPVQTDSITIPVPGSFGLIR